MKAAWDWHIPRENTDDERRLVEFVGDLGFDTLVIGNPTQALARAGRKREVQVVGVLGPRPGPEFTAQHAECLQQVQPYEEDLDQALRPGNRDNPQRQAHRWFPLIQKGDLLCYAHTRSVDYLKSKISELLQIADGIALDGFGFKNHYACFCDKCTAVHQSDPEQIAQYSQKSLVEISRLLYEHVKSTRPDALLINHVWPPFNPNPYYASELYLDYCTQTISWFYRPAWSLERVELEASQHKQLQKKDRNRFVPFIGLYNDAYQKRAPERVRRELEIALQFGEGNLVLCTMQAPWQDTQIRAVVKQALQENFSS